MRQERHDVFMSIVGLGELERFADLCRRGDTSEAAQLTAISIEKKLCAVLGREWSAAGMSVESLVDELLEKMRSNTTDQRPASAGPLD